MRTVQPVRFGRLEPVDKLLRSVRSSPRRAWWVSFVLLWLLGLLWSLATPLFGSPDEPAHVIRAVSAVRGEILEKAVPRGAVVKVRGTPVAEGDVVVDVPSLYATSGGVGCYAFQPQVPATCFSFDGPDKGEARAVTSAGRHPPSYYLFAGLPSLLIHPSARAVYLMRFWSGLLCAALLASALSTVFALRRRRPMVLGFAVALTPMALFLQGVVNPNGVEIAAAIALWIHALVLFDPTSHQLDNALVRRAGIAAIALVLARPLSPLWLGLIALAVLGTSTWSRVKELLGTATIRRWVVAVFACTIFQVAWVRIAGSLGVYTKPDGIDATAWTRLQLTLGKAFELLWEMVGVFGWRDTPSPTLVLVTWIVLLGGLVALALVGGRRRVLLILLGVTALVVVIPMLLEFSQSAHVGLYWQGRYTLPLAVGVPILAGFSICDTPWRVPDRVMIVFGAGLVVAQVFAFAQALRRNAVGAKGPLSLSSSSGWDPPIPALLLVALFAITVTALITYLTTVVGRELERALDGSAAVA